MHLVVIWTSVNEAFFEKENLKKKSDIIEGLKINRKNYFGTDKKVTL